MVIAPIVAAAAPAAVASATDDEGLINKLFKIGVLIGILVLAVISIFILSWVLEIGDIVGVAGDVIQSAAARASLTGFPIIGPISTFLLTAFAFGPRR